MACGVDRLIRTWEQKLRAWSLCKKIRSEEANLLHQTKIALLQTNIDDLKKAYYDDNTVKETL